MIIYMFAKQEITKALAKLLAVAEKPLSLFCHGQATLASAQRDSLQVGSQRYGDDAVHE